jgi:hypothetical protein
MLCVAALSVELLQVAVRVLPAPVSATAPQPEMVAPLSVKFTAPAGALPVTDAVNVTLVPTSVGFAELETVVVEDAGLTTCDSGALLDAALPESPANAATMLCVVALNADVLHVAVRVLPAPLSATALQVPTVAPPSVNLTVPVGALPATDAVKVTVAPTIAGFAELETVVVDDATFTT